MNRQEVESLLRSRSNLTHQPYGPDMIDAWTDMLDGHTHIDAMRAMRRIIEGGTAKFGIGDLMAQLPKAAQRVVEAKPDENSAGDCLHLTMDRWGICQRCGAGCLPPEEGFKIVRRELDKAGKSALYDKFVDAVMHDPSTRERKESW